MVEQQNHVPKICLGHPAIDAQHALLLALHAELVHSLQNEDDAFDLEGIFAGLSDYMATHFTYEEGAMMATHYQGRGEHCEEHRQMETNIGAFRSQFANAKDKNEEKTVLRAVSAFLVAWMTHHIEEVDWHMVQHLNNQIILIEV